MTPLEQTLLTVVCMVGAWWWGREDGKQRGIEIAVTFMQDQGFLKDNIKIEFVDEDEDE